MIVYIWQLNGVRGWLITKLSAVTKKNKKKKKNLHALPINICQKNKENKIISCRTFFM